MRLPRSFIDDAVPMVVILGIVTVMCFLSEYVNPFHDPELFGNPKYWVPIMQFNWFVLLPLWLTHKYRRHLAAEQSRRTGSLIDDVKALQDNARWAEANRLMDEIDRVTVLASCPCGHKGLYPRSMADEKVACTCGRTIKVPHGS